MESILNTHKGECYECGKICKTDLHHIFFGHSRRKISDREGLTVYLCPECHKGTYGVHGKYGEHLNKALKILAQQKWEERYIESYPYKNHAAEAAREAFIKLIGRNYIDD